MRIGWRVIVSSGVIATALAAAAGVGWISERTGTDRAFVIDQFAQRVVVEADGTTFVEEVIDVTFTTQRRGIFRDLPDETRFDGGTYTVLSVDQGTEAAPWNYTLERHDSGPRIRIGDANTWLSPGAYRYRLRYVAPTWSHRLADDPSLVETRINVPGFEWPTAIDVVDVAVELPGEIRDFGCVEGRVNAITRCAHQPQIDGTTAAINLGPYPHRQSATVALHTTADAFTAELPIYDPVPLGAWRPRQLFALEPVTAGFVTAILILLPLLLLDLVYARSVYRDRVTDPHVHDRLHPTAVFAPPRGWRPPEVAGLLLRRQPNPLFLAQLVDLDQRQAIRTSTALKGKSTTLTVERGPKFDDAAPSDRDFIDRLVPPGGSTTFGGTYDAAVAKRATRAGDILTKRARHVFRDNGLEHDGGKALRSAGIKVLLVLAVIVWTWIISASMANFGPLPTAAVVIIVLTVFVGWSLAHAPWAFHRLPLNSKGRDLAAEARAFREFVATVEGDQISWAADQPGIGHTHPALALLPYAIVFGLADSWYERFSEVLASLAVAGAAGAAAGGAAWWTTSSGFSSVRTSQSATTTAPSSGGSGGGGGGSGGGGGGGGSW